MIISEIEVFRTVANYLIWVDLDSLKRFVVQSGHAPYFRRRNEWFELAAEASSVCWWISAGDTPDLSEAYERLLTLRRAGPSP